MTLPPPVVRAGRSSRDSVSLSRRNVLLTGGAIATGAALSVAPQRAEALFIIDDIIVGAIEALTRYFKEEFPEQLKWLLGELDKMVVRLEEDWDHYGHAVKQNNEHRNDFEREEVARVFSHLVPYDDVSAVKTRELIEVGRASQRNAAQRARVAPRTSREVAADVDYAVRDALSGGDGHDPFAWLEDDTLTATQVVQAEKYVERSFTFLAHALDGLVPEDPSLQTYEHRAFLAQWLPWRAHANAIRESLLSMIDERAPRHSLSTIDFPSEEARAKAALNAVSGQLSDRALLYARVEGARASEALRTEAFSEPFPESSAMAVMARALNLRGEAMLSLHGAKEALAVLVAQEKMLKARVEARARIDDAGVLV